MSSKTKRQITIERHSITIIRTKDNPLSNFCQACQKIITTFESAQVTDFSPPHAGDGNPQIETDQVYLIGTEESVE